LKAREVDHTDEEKRRMKSVIAELATSKKLLRERIRPMEACSGAQRPDGDSVFS
jgi:hypothetical protein